MATPTFLLTPSGYKAGTLYAPLPADGDGDMEMTRSAIATRVNQNGIIQDSAVDVPRIDYLYGGCPSCIFEEATTNLVITSENFSAYTNVNASVSAGFLSPDGNTNARKLSGISGAAVQGRIQTPVSLPSSGNFTISVFAKAGDTNFLYLQPSQFDSSSGVYFDLGNGVVGTEEAGVTGIIENYGNGWYRCSARTSTTTDLNGNFAIWPAYSDSTYTFPSNALYSNASIYIFGAQAEAQDRPHSYVKTVVSPVSRAADLYRLTNIGQFFGTNTGAIYAEFADYPFKYESVNQEFMRMYDQSTGNDLRFRGKFDTFLGPQLVGWGGGPQYLTEPVVSTIRKVAFTWDGSDWKSKVNGQSEQTGSVTANFNPTIIGLTGGAYWTAASLVRLKTLAFYDRKLTSNELDELTTL